MSHADQSRNQPRKLSVARHNTNHFLTRDRLSDEELNEWITTAYGRTEAFQAAPEKALELFRQELDKGTRKAFGENMSIRSMGGILMFLDKIVTDLEQAQGKSLDRRELPPVLKQSYELIGAMRCAVEGKPLSRLGLQRLRQGDQILDAVADYAREAALVLPVTIKDEAVRDRIRPISRGMPAVDIKLTGIAREYREHIAPSIPSWSITGRIA